MMLMYDNISEAWYSTTRYLEVEPAAADVKLMTDGLLWIDT
jgi:hypothetical protein